MSHFTLTIGNFDGVHLGHQALLERARAEANGGDGNNSAKVIAITFDPLPEAVLSNTPRPLLTRVDERVRLLKEFGADEVVIVPCDRTLLNLEPEKFIESLRARFPFGNIVEGGDFRFGRGRSAGVAELKEIGQRLGFATVEVDEVLVRLEDGSSVPARSTTIRWLLAGGRVRDAARVLGRPYSLDGLVVSGDKRGRTIGFPTMNLDSGPLMLPADGVYSGWGSVPGGERLRAAISVGNKPTFAFGELGRACEAYLLGDGGPLDRYGFRLTLSFERWIRPQATFPDTASLVDQIKRDVLRVERELEGVTA
ncbi:MAG: riboflavin biosynthesis protein RibF [Phycisphaerales bacterium]|nr:riboflavin biosynthesis protein RibF [Phycisphaerales bacterium]